MSDSMTSVGPTLPAAPRGTKNVCWEDDAEQQQSDSKESGWINRSSKRHVSIKLESVHENVTSSWDYRKMQVAPVKSRPSHSSSIRKSCCVCSTFINSATGSIDHDMEKQFRTYRYKHFHGAFTQTSLLMPIGTLGLAISALITGHHVRSTLLALAVTPMYVIYGLLPMQKVARYGYDCTGRWFEQCLFAALCVHGIVIVFAEWARDDLDYGMLVMHIGFVHNFTPLGAFALHTISAAFGLVPYVVLKIMRHMELSREQAVHDKCSGTKGDTGLVLEILMPTLLFIYQVVVTVRRDHSLRLDLLSHKQLSAQRDQLNLGIQKCEDLLSSMLPMQIIAALKSGDPVEPQLFEDVTVVFIEICHFSRLCAQLPPKVVVEMLNVVYLEFDRLSDMLHVYKVETVGQVYMAVVGCPEPVVNHADVAAHFALAAQQSMKKLQTMVAQLIQPVVTPSFEFDDIVSGEPSPPACVQPPALCERYTAIAVMIRVGLNSGRIRAGVVGLDSPRYKLVGDTVNTASRMESTCEPGRIQLSMATRSRLSSGTFKCEDRGEIAIKGKGSMQTVWLIGYAGSVRTDLCEVVIDRHLLHRSSTGTTESDAMEHTSSMQSVPGDYWWNDAINTLHICSEKEDAPKWRDELRNSAISNHPRLSYDSFKNLFLLVPTSQKTREWMDVLRRDRPKFFEETLQTRIASARNLTIIWLLILGLVSAIDYFMEVLREDLPAYRSAILFRSLGNFVTGLVYLLLLTSPNLFRKHARRLTVGMLLAQGTSILAAGELMYNRESSIIAMFGAYVLFYTVCSISQRLLICVFSVVCFVALQTKRCKLRGLWESGTNIVFLLVFFVGLACGVRLQEHLEQVAHYEKRHMTKQLEGIKQTQTASLQLLNDMLPPNIVDQVSAGNSLIAEFHSDVTILFTDLKGFTAYSARIPVHELISFLNAMYSAFDEIIANWELHKVEIIGDAYFVSAGCPSGGPSENPSENAMRAVEVALALLRTLPCVCDDASVQMRVGLHTGSVVAGVVGKKGPRYHLFGAAVGYAEKMESFGVPGRVHISDATHSQLETRGQEYEFEERWLQVEDDGDLQRTWFVNKSNSKAALQIQKRLMMDRRSTLSLRRSDVKHRSSSSQFF